MSGKILFTKTGIMSYYSRAIASVPVKLSTKYTPCPSFFEKGDEDRDYHMKLKKLDNLKDKYILWHKRLRNVCSALIACAQHFGRNAELIELGIFGSETANSDIDIGVSYKQGTDLSNDATIPLSKVVRCFENYFVKLGYTSLDIDVEMYADYLISPINGLPFIQMNGPMYRNGIAYVLSGVLKNIVQAKYDKHLSCDVRRNLKSITNKNCFKNHGENIRISKRVLDDIDLLSEMSKLINLNALRPYRAIIMNLLRLVPKYEKKAKSILFEYLKLNYIDAANKYYKLLNKAHTQCMAYVKHPTVSSLNKLNEYISHALVFRAESYVNASTVYHIVYRNQANPTKEESERLHSLIGKQGYHLSFIEQFGYLTRFYIEYSCELRNCNHSEKLMRKYKKYTGRIISAIKNYRKFAKSRKRAPKRNRSVTRKK